ncbi:Retrovirus-related Pol polyprotein from transposon TNT 1-94 [Anthophora retusa]
MNPTGVQQCKKLDNTKYESWKIQIKSILRYNELWGYVEGTIKETEQNQNTWKLRDEKALDIIILSLNKSQYNHVKNAQASKEAWEMLQRVYESSEPMKQYVLFKKLYRMKKDTNQSMAEYIDKFTHCIELLNESGIELSREVLPIMLLNSLPNEYETFCIALESRGKMPSMEELKVKLLEEEIRKTEATGNVSNDKEEALLSNRKFTRYMSGQRNNYPKQKPDLPQYRKNYKKCHACGKIGHFARECRSKVRLNGRRSNGEDAMIAIALNTYLPTAETWCLDSGATTHICNDRKKFISLDNRQQNKVYTATNNSVNALGRGNVKIATKSSNGNTNTINLRDVLWVPDFRNNLLSVSSITENGYKVFFNEHSAVVKHKDDTIALTAQKRTDLYIMNTVNVPRAMQAKEQNNRLIIKDLGM